MKSNKLYQKNGFTLVEILIALGVLAVGLFAFLPSFSGASKKRNLVQAVENAKDAIATVRNQALTETGNPGEANALKYSAIKFTKGSSSYLTFRSVTADASTCQAAQPNMDSDAIKSGAEKSLPGGVQAKIDSSESPMCIFFEFGTGNTYVTKGTSQCAPCSDD